MFWLFVSLCTGSTCSISTPVISYPSQTSCEYRIIIDLPKVVVEGQTIKEFHCGR